MQRSSFIALHQLRLCPLLLIASVLYGCDQPESMMPTVMPGRTQTASELARPVPAHILTTVGDAFGNAVAISADGSTLAISAPGEDSDAEGVNGDEFNNNAINSGAVYLYHNSGTGWVRQAYLKAKDSHLDDQFGTALSLSADGSVLAVGAAQTDDLRAQEDSWMDVNVGSVYLFRRKQQQWYQEAKLKASNADSFDRFGSALTLSADGRTLAVAALGEDSKGDSKAGGGAVGDDNQLHNAGAVYLFRYHQAQWQQQAFLKASPAEEMEGFGHALSLSADGQWLAVGANRHDGLAAVGNTTQRLNNAGAVYLFRQLTDQWQLQTRLGARYADERDNFGSSVSLNADATRLAVGAQGEAASPGVSGEGQDNSAPSAGAVYLFERLDGQWQQQVYLKASNGEPNDGFGTQLQLSAKGTTLMVSAPWEDGAGGSSNNNALQAGAVYVYALLGDNWKQTAYLKARMASALDQFGNALSLNADGTALLVGAAGEDAGRLKAVSGYQAGTSLNSGAAYLFREHPGQWQQDAYFKSGPDGSPGKTEVAVQR